MNRMLISIASVALVAAAGIGLVVGFMPAGLPSTAAPAAATDQTAAAVVDGLKTGADPDPAPPAGPDVKVAQDQTQAETKQTKQTEYGLWVLSCADVPAGAPKKCAARLALRDTKRNVTVVNWLIGRNKDNELLMEITTPVDVLIQPGLQLGIGDGAAQSFPYLSCGADGCLTRFRPDAQLLKDLHPAETVKLIIVTPAGKSLTITIKVNGIAETLDALAQP